MPNAALAVWLTLSGGSVVWYQKCGLWTQTHSGSNLSLPFTARKVLNKLLSVFQIPFYLWMKNTITLIFRTLKGVWKIIYRTHNRCLILLIGHYSWFLGKAILWRTEWAALLCLFLACSGHWLSLSHGKSGKGYLDQMQSRDYNPAPSICVQIAWWGGKSVATNIWCPSFKSQLWELLSHFLICEIWVIIICWSTSQDC